jgi:hypothetical protein
VTAAAALPDDELHAAAVRAQVIADLRELSTSPRIPSADTRAALAARADELELTP